MPTPRLAPAAALLAAPQVRRAPGRYGGDHRVLAREGRLWLQRGEGTVPVDN
jgi:hypothetical protein